MNALARTLKSLLLISALGLISMAIARPIFCDRFESESCLVLPRVTLATPELSTFEAGALTIGLEKGALPGGQDVFLTSSDPGILSLPPSVRLDEGQTEFVLPIATEAGFGSVTLEATAQDHQAAMLELVVSPRGLQLVAASLIESGNSLQASIQLDRPAPPGGALVSVVSSDASVVSVLPSELTIPEGDAFATVNLSGGGAGTAELSASAPGYEESAVVVTGIADILSVGSVSELTPGQSRSLPISLLEPAPAGGMTILLESTDPGVVSVDASVEIPEGLQLPTAAAIVQGLTVGDATISARAVGFATRQRPVVVRPFQLDLGGQSLDIPEDWTLEQTLTLSSAAPPGGIDIALSSSNPGVLAVPNTVSIPGGQVTATFEITGLSLGSAELLAQGDDVEPANVQVTVGNPPAIALEDLFVGRGLQDYHEARLTRVPPAPVDMVLSVDDPSIALLSDDPDLPGSASISVPAEFSAFTRAPFQVQGMNPGTTVLTASADGYSDAQATLTVTPAGLYIVPGSSKDRIFTTTVSGDRTLSLESARLNPDGSFAEEQDVRAGLDLTVPVNNSNPSVGRITVNPVTIEGGAGSGGWTRFEPLNEGVTVISLVQPFGFIEPTDRPGTIEVQVVQPHYFGDVVVGQGLQTSRNSAASFITFDRPVTLTVTDPGVALLSDDDSTPGSSSVTLDDSPFVFGQRVYIQGISQGSTTLIASTPGFPTIQSTIQVRPAGFYIESPSAINTTPVSLPMPIRVRSSCLGDDDFPCGRQALRPGLVVEVPISSSNPAVGVLSGEVVVFPGDMEFQPLAPGSTTVRITQPPGFVEPADLDTSIEASVALPQMLLSNASVGEDLQDEHRLRYGTTAQGGEEITIRVDDPSIAVLTLYGGSAGTAEVVFETINGHTFRDFYIQGLAQGETELIAFGPSFPEVRANLKVTESGFMIYAPEAISASIGGSPRELSIRLASLDSNGLVIDYESVRSGLTVEVPLVVADPSVGELTTSPLVFSRSDGSSRRTRFAPRNFGTTTIDLIQPAQFSVPAEGAQSIEAQVGVPDLFLNDIETGAGLQRSGIVRLTQTPLAAVDIELSVADPSMALLSPDALTPGASSLTLPAIGNTVNQSFRVQGLAEGTTTLTARAAGFDDAQALLTVGPSGFAFLDDSLIRTTLRSEPEALSIMSFAELEFGPYPLELNPETTIAVPIDNSNPSVGQITLDPVVFESGQGIYQSTAFDPQSIGATTISVGSVPGFTAIDRGQSLDIEVGIDRLSVADITVGRNLQQSGSIGFGTSLAESTDIVVTVANSSIARVSGDRNLAGSGSLVLNAAAGSASKGFYLQGINQGTTTVTVSAAGFEPDQATVTVKGSGFFISGPSAIETTHYSDSTEIRIASAMVGSNGAALSGQELRGGLTVQVPMTFTNPAVGQLSTSPVVFTGGSGSVQEIDFTPGSIGTSDLNLSQPAGFIAPNNLRQSIEVVVAAADINLADVFVGKDLQDWVQVELDLAPPVPVDLSLLVDDPSIALLSASRVTAGSAAIILDDVSSTQSRSFYVQGLSEGSTTIRALAPGYFTEEATLTVTPSGFFIDWPSSISTTVLSGPSSVLLGAARLHADGQVAERQEVRAGLTVAVPVGTGHPAVAAITNSPVPFNGGSQPPSAQFAPIAVGSTTVNLVQPPGFTQPVDESVSIDAQVRAPEINFNSEILVGESLEAGFNFRLSVTPPEPVDVLLSIADPTVALVTRNGGFVGEPSAVIPDVSNTWSQPFWIQGLAEGSTQLTISAPGYEDRVVEVTISDSGFYFSSSPELTTTTYSGPLPITIRVAPLDEDGSILSSQPIRPGVIVGIPVVSDQPSVGQIMQSPLALAGGASSVQASFEPIDVGSATVTLTQPAGFSVPSAGRQSVDVMVRQPDIRIQDFHVGEHLQNDHRFNLERFPPSAVDVLLTVDDPTIAALSESAMDIGSATLLVEDVANVSFSYFQVQGLSQGTTTITATADGYATTVAELTVTASGFHIAWPSSITTTPISAPTEINVRTAQATPSGSWQSGPEVRPGLNVELPIALADPSLGVLDDNLLVFTGGGDAFASTAFSPTSLGLTTLDLTQPEGFTAPDGFSASIDVEVVVPTISLFDITVDQGEQRSYTTRLETIPIEPVDLTLTIANPSIATISRFFNEVGASSVTYQNVSSTFSNRFYIEGLTPGTTTLTATAPGFQTRQVILTVTAP